ncbi:MAG: HPr family phosphocarrier protein [Planctomycetota bacterium]|jgi:phosphotransferase system HPr (HPr) family protein|nr:phosphocarrier protein HPr [Planctomycetota bacterium]MDP6368450.1 HPr family phosphocarrier protein [Planctomycetota bacterium]MDP6837722.1 HPr family phosphocarrier protein [Planctomycetota bacterium]MDP6956042.1 HPr family phosphocarrier protein [Planctomycetota bacterium]
MELRCTVCVVNSQGLHARPCHAVVALALEYAADLTVCNGDQEVNGKSILALMTLNAPQGTELVLMANGTDGAELLERLERLFLAGFDYGEA